MKKILILIVSMALVTGACGKGDQPVFIIYPDQCEITIGQDFPISLQGSNIPENGVITWTATKGEINPPTGYSVIYTAPQEPGTVSINAILKVNGVQSSAKGLTCEILAPATEVPPTLPPVTEPSTKEPPSPIPPTPSGPIGDTIAISEVMAYPCGANDRRPSINEYIELYNYGAANVDVKGWWIGTTGGGKGTPDQLVPWNAVNPKVDLGSSLRVNETVIPPGGYAVVVSPQYHTGVGNFRMPYAFPMGTVILTFSTSDYLGNDSKGLVATEHPLTTIVLYKGSNKIISTVISTYGTPSYGSAPENIMDDKADNFPYFLSQCHAMERIDAAAADALSNWRDISVGTPGSGNYNP